MSDINSNKNMQITLLNKSKFDKIQWLLLKYWILILWGQ